MPGFESLPGALNQGEGLAPILPGQVALAGGPVDDITALKIVTQDVIMSASYVGSKNAPTDWEQADNLYRAQVRPRVWPGTDVPRSNLSMPVVLDAVEKLMPSLYGAFFSDKQPFLILPKGKTTPEAARAKAALLLWAVKVSGFKEQIRKALKHCLVYGFVVLKWGWKTTSRSKKTYDYEDPTPGAKDFSGSRKVVSKEETEEISHPTLEACEIRNVLFSANLKEHDIRKSEWVALQLFPSADFIDSLRDDPAYKNVPPRADLETMMALKEEPTTNSMMALTSSTYRDLQAQPQDQPQSANPAKQPLELIEYTSNDYVFTVLQQKIVIRNAKNEFGKKTFLSCAFIDVPGSAYGFGVGKLLGGEQRLQTGVVNKWLDSLALVLNPSYQEQTGIGAGSQNISLSPGKIVRVNAELKPLITQSITAEAVGAIQASEIRAARRVGTTGGANLPSAALRTAEGVKSFDQETVDGLQYFIDIFADTVYVPALEAFLEICGDRLQPEDIKRILSEEDAQEYQGDILDVYNGECEIQTLSSTKLAARRAAANLVPLLMQLVSAQPVQDSLITQGKKFDYAEFITEVIDLTGWDCDSLIVPATPEEIKRHMDMQPGMAQAQSAMALQAQKHADTMEEISATAMGRAGVSVVKHALDQSAEVGASVIPKTGG